MERSAQRKLAVACLGIAVGALILDRTLLRDSLGPQTALAAVPTPESSTDAATRPSAAPERPVGRVAEHLRRVAARLDAGQREPPDVFDPRLVFGAQAPGLGAGGDGAVLTCEQFRARHVLSAVILAADGSVVMLKGRAVRLGEVIDGFELVEVRAGAARFESASAGVVELAVPTPDNSRIPAGDSAEAQGAHVEGGDSR
jgi:hypothetical protein